MRCIDEVRGALDGYRFNDAATALYRFLWNEFCDWYVELAKPSLAAGAASRETTVATLVAVLECGLRLLHPVMPFLTEELWHALPGVDATRPTLLNTPFPRGDAFERDEAAEARVERLVAVVRALRNLRAEMSLPPSREIDLLVAATDAQAAADLPALTGSIRTLARVGKLDELTESQRPSGSAVAVAGGLELYVPLAGLIDVAAERERLEREIERVAKDLAAVTRKLDNQDFMSRAPDEIVAKERAKEHRARRQGGAAAARPGAPARGRRVKAARPRLVPPAPPVPTPSGTPRRSSWCAVRSPRTSAAAT